MSQLQFQENLLKLQNLSLKAYLAKIDAELNLPQKKLDLQNEKLENTIKSRLTSAKVGSLISQDEDHATYFFLKGDMVNGRGWGVTSPSIPANIKTAIGMPFTITSNDFFPDSPYGPIYDHPSLEHLVPLGLAAPGTVDLNDKSRLLDFQKDFKVATMKDFFFSPIDDHWRVVVTKTPEFRGKEFPPFVSPGVWKLDKSEPDEAMTKWDVMHLTGLDERPAYGSMAIKKAECKGSLLKCHTQLRAASLGISEMMPCEFKKMIAGMKRTNAYMGVLSSPSISETEVQRVFLQTCLKKDKNGVCIKTDSKKSKRIY